MEKISSLADKAKEAVSGSKDGEHGNTTKSHFETGFRVPVQQQESIPGKQSELRPEPVNTKLPTQDEGYQTYKAAGKLDGKNALITGGDSGIGRAVAILYAMEGADSFIVYLPDEEKDAQETKRRVEQLGRKCFLYPTDLTSRVNCKAAVDAAINSLGQINILVNNAAFQNMKESIDELSEDQWVHTFNVNIHPYFFMAKYVLPQMKRGDTIINNASINAYIGRPDLLDYTSTKGAIVSFTRGLANQQVEKGIRVNAVCPGPVWTPLIPATMNEEALKQFTSPLGRPAQPSEIATSFVFLASPDSSMYTGQSLHPNGGTVVNG